jgi:hypothetical protein
LRKIADFLFIFKTTRGATMYHKLVATGAWLSLAFIVFATLSPIGLRPHVAGAGLERFSAFAATGLLFGLAYRRRLGLVVALVLCGACILEMTQLILPDRHGRLLDLFVKMAGGATGCLIAQFWNRLRGRTPTVGLNSYQRVDRPIDG